MRLHKSPLVLIVGEKDVLSSALQPLNSGQVGDDEIEF